MELVHLAQKANAIDFSALITCDQLPLKFFKLEQWHQERKEVPGRRCAQIPEHKSESFSPFGESRCASTRTVARADAALERLPPGRIGKLSGRLSFTLRFICRWATLSRAGLVTVDRTDISPLPSNAPRSFGEELSASRRRPEGGQGVSCRRPARNRFAMPRARCLPSRRRQAVFFFFLFFWCGSSSMPDSAAGWHKQAQLPKDHKVSTRLDEVAEFQGGGGGRERKVRMDNQNYFFHTFCSIMGFLWTETLRLHIRNKPRQFSLGMGT